MYMVPGKTYCQLENVEKEKIEALELFTQNVSVFFHI